MERGELGGVSPYLPPPLKFSPLPGVAAGCPPAWSCRVRVAMWGQLLPTSQEATGQLGGPLHPPTSPWSLAAPYGPLQTSFVRMNTCLEMKYLALPQHEDCELTQFAAPGSVLLVPGKGCDE